MNIDTGKKLTSPFLVRAHADNDAAFVVHFSRKDDYFEGRAVNLDEGGALLIIENLARQFGISPKRLLKHLDK